ncbi:MAG: FkbM family methyltransferase [Pseudomonadota bacterium]
MERDAMQAVTEFEPDAVSWRMARRLRSLVKIRGVRRLRSLLLGSAPEQAFRVRNSSGVFEGDLSSLLERNVYLDGGYESEQIACFLDLVPGNRRGTLLDIGANIGTHSIAFAGVFARVHAFEPNPTVVKRLKNNIGLNPELDVTVHEVALGEAKGVFPFYAPAGDNHGQGTLSTVEQYETSLVKLADVQVEAASAYIDQHIEGPIDAIKIDVQGTEKSVLRGLKGIILRDDPIIWVELETPFYRSQEALGELKDLLGHKQAFRLTMGSGLFVNFGPEPSDLSSVRTGNYVFV